MQQSFYDNFNYDELIQDGALNSSIFNYEFDYQHNINFLSQQQKPQPLNQMKDITLESYLIRMKQAEPLKQSCDCLYELSQLDQEFVQKIEDHDFQNHLRSVVQPCRRMFKLIPVEVVMQHQTEQLDKAITLGPFKDMQKKAKEIFCLLLQFGQDQASLSPPIEQVQKILELIEDRNQMIIDELYFQIVKQIINNNSTVVLYAQLLTLVCSLYPPSLLHLLPLLNFFYYNALKEKSPTLLLYWKFHIKRICKSYNYLDKMVPTLPTESEILSIMNLRPLTIHIVVYGLNYLEYEVEHDSKVGTILSHVKQKLNVRDISLCMTQMLAGQIEEFYLQEDQLVVEVVWEQQRAIKRIKERVVNRIKDSQQIIERIDGTCRFVIKASMTSIPDVMSISLAYMVTIDDYLNGQFTLNSKEVQLVAALKLTADSGHSSEHSKLHFDYTQYVPLHKRSEQTEDVWLKNILKIYLKQDKITQREARIRIVDYFKSQFAFLASRFQCTMYETPDKLQKIILHIGYNGTSCSSVQSPRQPFLTKLSKAVQSGHDGITMQKGERVYYFKFSSSHQCQQAYKMMNNKSSVKDVVQQYNTAFL